MSMNDDWAEGEIELACLVGTLPPERGISRYFERLVSAIGELAPIQITVVEPGYLRNLQPGSGGRLEAVERSARIPKPRIVNSVSPLAWIRSARETRAGVVHVQWWSPIFAPALLALIILWRIRMKKLVLTIHNVRSHEAPVLSWLPLAMALKLAHAVVVHHKRGLSAIQSQFDGIVRQIRPGILGRPLGTRTQSREVLGIDEDTRVILFFGNIRPYKGLDVLLRAYPEVKDIDDALLLIAGDCWEDWEARYGELTRQLGSKVQVRIGFQPEDQLDLLFSSADVVVLPYLRFSGQSGVGTVALNYGCPLIVSNVGGLPELVEDSRYTFAAGDHRGLADLLREVVIGETLLKKRREAVRGIASTFTWDDAARSHVRLYREVMSP